MIMTRWREQGNDFSSIIRYFPNDKQYESFTLKNKDDIAAFTEHHPTKEDQFFYTSFKTYDLKQGNFRTGRAKTIAKGCEASWYQRFSVSPEGGKILSDRYNQIIRDSIFPGGEVIPVLHHYQSIFIMDIRRKQFKEFRSPLKIANS